MTMETMRRSHLYEQLPYAQIESGEYEYPRAVDGSPSGRLLPHDFLTLSENSSLASGGAARCLRPNILSSQLSGQSHCYQSNAYRRRENPLYQSVSQIEAKSSVSRHRCDCISAVSIVLTLFACLVSFISVGIAVSMHRAVLPVTMNHTYVEDLDVLHLKYDLLVKQMDEMKQEEIQLLKVKYALLANQSQDVQTELYQKINKLRDDFGQQLSNISKMRGPPGPPGLANMAACKYTTRTGGGASAVLEIYSPWIPIDAVEANQTVITGIECSTRGGSAAFLNSTTTNGFIQFRCRCFGTDYQNSTSRLCYINYWFCPINN